MKLQFWLTAKCSLLEARYHNHRADPVPQTCWREAVSGFKVLFIAFLCHPCIVGSKSGGCASSSCFQMQHCKHTLGRTESVVGCRHISFRAETILLLSLSLSAYRTAVPNTRHCCSFFIPVAISNDCRRLFDNIS